VLRNLERVPPYLQVLKNNSTKESSTYNTLDRDSEETTFSGLLPNMQGKENTQFTGKWNGR
jgi:hypothetical protein